MSINTPPITPQQYEVLHGGGAEAAEIAKQRLSRRRFLRRSLLAVFGLSATASVAGAVNLLYPNLAGQFGAVLHLAQKRIFRLPGQVISGSDKRAFSIIKRRKPTLYTWLKIQRFL